MNFLELCVRVREESGISDTGPASVTGQTGILGLIVSWVRQADLDIQNLENQWRFLWTRAPAAVAVPNQLEYLPADLNVVTDQLNDRNLSRMLVDDNIVPFLTWELYVSWIERSPVEFGPNPRCVTVTPDGKFKFWPVIDTAVSVVVDYYASPVSLTLGTDISKIPPQYHETIVDKAMLYYGRSENDQMAFDNAQFMYSEHLSRIEHTELPQAQFGGSQYNGF